MVRQGKRSPKPGFGQEHSGEKLRHAIESHLSHAIADAGYAILSEDINKIRAFSENEQESDKRWERLTRLVDGKKALSRVCNYLSRTFKIDSVQPWEEMRGCLANRIASENLIDAELEKVISYYAEASEL